MTIRVKSTASEPRRAASFSQWLPGMSSERPPSRRGKKARRPQLQGIPVLVVDDDPASAKLLSILLRAEGCDTRSASSAEEAVVVLGSFRPHVIVLDVILPLMGGLLFAQRLKADPATRDIVIIAVSAVSGVAAKQGALDAGCAAFLPKPIDPLTFPNFVRDHLPARP
jgi:two-component system cell cycle response regulator DivK